MTATARLRKFWVNATPKHDNGIYQRSTDHGLTISVMALNVRNGFHKMDDYPKGTAFDFVAFAD